MAPDGEKNYFTALTIAGSDSCGGAGIQADLKTFSALGCYGMSILTALTAQNTVGVRSIHDVPPDFVSDQLNAIFEDIVVDAVKIGMLRSPEIICAVSGKLKGFGVERIVADPVMVAKGGDPLLLDEAVQTLREEIVPIATVLTPNIQEASLIAQRDIATQDDMERAARELCALGPKAVVVKGGNLPSGPSDDCVVITDSRGNAEIHWLRQERIETNNTHGTGCSFSSAIAAGLARSLGIEQAIRNAKEFISQAIRSGACFRLGKGHGPVNHFYDIWKV